MEGLDGNVCGGEDSMALRGVSGYSGATNELGQAAIAASQWQEALQVLKQKPAALLLSGQSGLKSKAKHQQAGGDGDSTVPRLPRSTLV